MPPRLIAEPLYLFGTIERMGTGTLDIIKKCKQAGLKTPEFIEEEIFTVTLWRNKESSRTGGQISGQISGIILSDTQKKIIKIIIENPKISRNDLSKLLEINTSAIQKQMAKLKQMGIMEREGPDKGGYWKIIEHTK
jgi:predicted HTH transcriptional regulator